MENFVRTTNIKYQGITFLKISYQLRISKIIIIQKDVKESQMT